MCLEGGDLEVGQSGEANDFSGGRVCLGSTG